MKLRFILAASALWLLLSGFCNAADLVGYWPLDENQGAVAGDAIGDYDGIIHGCTWIPAKIGSGLSFNGTSTDYVEISNTTSPNPYRLTHVTLSAWIYPKAYPTGYPMWWNGIVGKAYYTESTYGIRLGYDRKLYFCVYGPFGAGGSVKSFSYKSSSDILLNEWHHVAVTYDGEYIKFYLDGALDAVYTESRLSGLYNQNIFIGSTYANGRYFNGYIDEVKIYNGALTIQEVEAEYERSGETVPYSADISAASTAPVIDGFLNDACWQTAATVDFVDNSTEGTPNASTTGYMCYDSENLYFGFLCSEPNISSIVATVSERDGRVCDDDCVELFIDTGFTRTSCYYFGLNTLDTQADDKWNSSTSLANGWDGFWEGKTQVGANSWSAEMHIPLTNFALDKAVGNTWGINLCRERKTQSEVTSWSPTFGKLSNPQYLGTVHGLNIDFSPYKTGITAPSLYYEFTDGRLKLICTQTFTNNTSSAKQIKIIRKHAP